MRKMLDAVPRFSASQFCLSRRVVYYLLPTVHTVLSSIESQFCLSRRVVYYRILCVGQRHQREVAILPFSSAEAEAEGWFTTRSCNNLAKLNESRNSALAEGWFTTPGCKFHNNVILYVSQFCLSRRVVYYSFMRVSSGLYTTLSQFCLSRRVVYY